MFKDLSRNNTIQFYSWINRVDDTIGSPHHSRRVEGKREQEEEEEEVQEGV